MEVNKIWELYEHRGLGALMRQLCFIDAVKHEKEYSVDNHNGTLELGDMVFDLQFIGTEAPSDNTFLWGWSFESPGIPANAMEFINSVASHELFADPLHVIDELSGHEAAIVCCAIANPRPVGYLVFPYKNSEGIDGIEFDLMYLRSGVLPEVKPTPIMFNKALINVQNYGKYNVRKCIVEYLTNGRIPYAILGDTIEFNIGGSDMVARFYEDGGLRKVGEKIDF